MIIPSNQVAPNFPPAVNTSRKQSISGERAKVGANQAQLTSAVSETDLTAVGSPLQDEDSAQATTERARSLMLSQAATAMLAQASAMRPEALQLLQQ